MSYAVFVEIKGEKPTTNGCRYATEEEAKRAGSELLSRWWVPTGFHVEETNDPVNYEFPEGHPRPFPLRLSGEDQEAQEVTL